MGKLIGLILMILGIALIIGKIILNQVSFFSQINILLAVIVSLILVVAGLLFMKEPKSKQEREVPIFEGEGKKRKVVGYKREK